MPEQPVQAAEIGDRAAPDSAKGRPDGEADAPARKVPHKAQRRGRSARHREQAAEPPPGARPVWPGVEGGRYRPLTEREVTRIHETALDLLERIGLASAIPSMVERVVAAGGRLTETGRLLFPRALVEDTVAGARRSFVVHGQRPGLEMELGGTRVHVGSGGASPSIVDLETGAYRDATLRDLYDAARLADRLDNIHFFHRSLVARDVSDTRDFDINTAYAILAGTAKPLGTSFSQPAHVRDVVAMFDEAAGGEGRFRRRPFCTLLSCHVVPPLRFAEEACAALEEGVRLGMPVMLISAGQAGATSPAALAGSVVQAVAEVLAGLVFVRLIDPEVKCVLAPKPLVSDLRTGAMSGGSGEQAVLMAAAAQMANFYGLPSSVMAGMTDAKIADAQHGYEKGHSVALAAHAGTNVISQSCGMEASLLGLSLEGYVIDNDMLG
ncbi:MAG: trimethylamine methyltransferase family protein, partial [Kiloniellales bacterium]|nr:trimethylamine methyltransferase family protein [Kiloniellales bacterium]